MEQLINKVANEYNLEMEEFISSNPTPEEISVETHYRFQDAYRRVLAEAGIPDGIDIREDIRGALLRATKEF